MLSAKLYFLEIGPVHQKLWPFTCMMLKTLNSNFLDWEDTLNPLLFSSGLYESWQIDFIFHVRDNSSEHNGSSNSLIVTNFFPKNKQYVTIKLKQNETNLWTILLVRTKD